MHCYCHSFNLFFYNLSFVNPWKKYEAWQAIIFQAMFMSNKNETYVHSFVLFSSILGFWVGLKIEKRREQNA